MPQTPTPRSAPQKRPAHGGAAPSPAKKTLSPEELARREAARREAAKKAREREAARREEEARRARQKRERRRSIFLFSAITAVVFFALYWGWVALDIALRPDGTKDALPVMIFTENEREKDKEFTVEESFFGGVSYLPLSCLEEYVPVSEFGDHETRSFMICDTEEYATFYLGTENAVINGEKVSLTAPAFVKDNVLYLPLDFYATKLNCFKLEISAPLGASVLTFKPDVKASLAFGAQEDVAVIPESSLPEPPPPPAEEETQEQE